MDHDGFSRLVGDQDEATILDSMLTGMLKYVTIAPAWAVERDCGDQDFTTMDRVYRLQRAASWIYADYPEKILSFSDRLYGVLNCMQPEEFDFEDPLLSAYLYASATSVGAIVFWDHIWREVSGADAAPKRAEMLTDYLEIHSDRWRKDSAGDYMISPLDTMALVITEEITDSSFTSYRSDASMSFENVALVVLQQMQHAISEKKTAAQMQRQFFFHDDNILGPTQELARLEGLQSVSCMWPEHTDSSAQSKGHALAMFMLIEVFRNYLWKAKYTSGTCQKIKTALHDLVDFFKPAWNVPLRFVHSQWESDCLSIELSYFFWKALWDRGDPDSTIDHKTWRDASIRVICFPSPEKNERRALHTGFGSCTTSMINAMEGSRRRLMSLATPGTPIQLSLRMMYSPLVTRRMWISWVPSTV